MMAHLYLIAKCGIDAYGIEPSSNLSDAANSNNCMTINGFFDEESLNELEKNQSRCMM